VKFLSREKQKVTVNGRFKRKEEQRRKAFTKLWSPAWADL
jgi:hypothetical protein